MTRRTFLDTLNLLAPARPADACWLWQGRLLSNGYGSISRRVDGGRKTYLAHRVAYETWVGPIPEGLVLDHLCRIRRCIRPSHLEAVPQQVNVSRAFWPDGLCRRGHDVARPGSYVVRADGRRRCVACEQFRAKRRWARKKAARTDRPEATP